MVREYLVLLAFECLSSVDTITTIDVFLWWGPAVVKLLGRNSILCCKLNGRWHEYLYLNSCLLRSRLKIEMLHMRIMRAHVMDVNSLFDRL